MSVPNLVAKAAASPCCTDCADAKCCARRTIVQLSGRELLLLVRNSGRNEAKYGEGCACANLMQRIPQQRRGSNRPTTTAVLTKVHVDSGRQNHRDAGQMLWLLCVDEHGPVVNIFVFTKVLFDVQRTEISLQVPILDKLWIVKLTQTNMKIKHVWKHIAMRISSAPICRYQSIVTVNRSMRTKFTQDTVIRVIYDVSSISFAAHMGPGWTNSIFIWKYICSSDIFCFWSGLRYPLLLVLSMKEYLWIRVIWDCMHLRYL